MHTIPVGLAVAATAAAFVTLPALAQENRTIESVHHLLEAETVASGLEHPWGLALLPDGRFLVTERNPGNLRVGSRDGELSEPLRGVPEIFRYRGDTPRSQAGLFDVTLHPEFGSNQLVYLSLSKPSERGTGTAIVRGRLTGDGDEASLEDVETVFEMNDEDQDSSGLHFGGRMAFDPDDGALLLTIGERRNLSRAQARDDQAGSIIRIDADGGVPSDNPFVDAEDTDGKIHSFGHRNPQGIAFEPGSGDLWVNDHGPLGGDRINRVEAGENYGWPYISAGPDYSGAPIGVGTHMGGMESPFHVFDGTVAPSGLAFYDGELFGNWQGDQLHGGLVTEGIVRVTVEGDEVVDEERIDLGRRIRDVQVADDGAIWLITEHEDGEVLRLTPVE